MHSGQTEATPRDKTVNIGLHMETLQRVYSAGSVASSSRRVCSCLRCCGGRFGSALY